MRVVSLLPGWTEWMGEFGALHLLVGRSHLCDFPPPVTDIPSVTFASRLDGGTSRMHDGQPHLQVDLVRLASLKPDIILTNLPSASFSELDGTPDILSPHASTLRQVLTAVLAIGRSLGLAREAMEALARRERELRLFWDRTGLSPRAAPRSRHSILCLESVEPLVAAGLWVPGLVEMAGGRAVCTMEGEPSRTVSFEEIRSSNPDVIAVLTAARSMEKTAEDWRRRSRGRGWSELAAIRRGRVYGIDDCFVRPGPRLYRGIELFAAALFPGAGPLGMGEVCRLAP